ncbi:hypothetical protein [Pseudomonas extremaustralis]|uniref:hypothetical protein n=1 Tax=Pseudomonas extremaustralis TaxID=359110 RepID=UPI002AA0CFC8|nr:hypothetical protein [Pseudomonas extremaustralis]
MNVFMVVRPFIVVGKTQRGAVETVERPLTPCAQICRANVTAATSCRSELAREEREFDTFIQEARVIVDDFREQARSYKGLRGQV